MAEKGVIVEFDFTVLNGAELLFETTKSFLKALDGIEFDLPVEARHFAGNDYLDGFRRYFSVVKTKKTAQKAARDLSEAFAAAVTREAPGALTVAFKNFVKALQEKGVRVVIATRADLESVRPAFVSALGPNIAFYQEPSACYGAVRWESWRRACRAGGVRAASTLAVTGSGAGVKAALLAGMGSVAVVNDHVAYQDFGGAQAAVGELSGKTAKKVLEVLRI